MNLQVEGKGDEQGCRMAAGRFFMVVRVPGTIEEIYRDNREASGNYYRGV